MREITSSILLVRSAALWWDRFARSTCLIWVLILNSGLSELEAFWKTIPT